MKIAIMTTENKWWPYYICKDFCDYLSENTKHEVYLFRTKKDYLRLHFSKFDLIISVIPFLFKPLWAKRFFYYLHGNYKNERKNTWLWTKLLYFAWLNLWFCDKILLTSYFLADKLWFRDRYSKKINILSNYVKPVTKNKHLKENDLKFLTITSFSFYEKWKWVINLWDVIKRVWEAYRKDRVIFDIIWDTKTDFFKTIKESFDKIEMWENIEVHWKWFVRKELIEKEYHSHNNFLYRTNLDNTPWTVLEALNYGLNVYTNNYESFQYFLDKKYICNNEDEMVEKIIKKEDTRWILNEKMLFESVCNDLINIIES